MEKSTGEQIKDVVLLILEVLILIVKCLYFNLEAIYRKFVPAQEVSVKGEIVLVTGAGHGIGKQFALQYASHGATVICCDINEETNKQTIKDIQKKGYPKAYGYVCDVSSRQNVFETVAKIQQDVGDISIIVNNAGIMPTHSLIDHSEKEIQRIFGINVFAHMWILQAVLPSMIKNRKGHIVAVSSCAGIMGLSNLVPYCASKFAVFGMMEALHQEMKLYKHKNINMTVVCPYMVDTGLCKKPIARFMELMPILPPEEVVSKAISAQRQGVKVLTIPSYILTLNNALRCGAIKAADALFDFCGVYLDSDLH